MTLELTGEENLGVASWVYRLLLGTIGMSIEKSYEIKWTCLEKSEQRENEITEEKY